MTFVTVTRLPHHRRHEVTSIKVNGTELLLSGATAFATTTARWPQYRCRHQRDRLLRHRIEQRRHGHRPDLRPSTYTPVITTDPSSGGISAVTDAFPESTPAKLQNFANWYSYYSTPHADDEDRCGTGVRADHRPVSRRVHDHEQQRNGHRRHATFVDIAPFDATQKSAWYSKLYASNPGNSTPLREVLSKVGRLYAHKYGAITTYTSTITVSGSGSTSVRQHHR